MRKVLIPVDGSASALNAVRHVSNRYVQEGDLEVHLLHVNKPLPKAVGSYLSRNNLDSYYRDQAVMSLEPAAELLNRFGVTVYKHVARGEKAETIHQQAQQLGVDEIVMGTSRKNAFTRMVQGSVTNQVMSIATVPVELIATGEESAAEKYGLPAGIGATLTLLLVATE